MDISGFQKYIDVSSTQQDNHRHQNAQDSLYRAYRDVSRFLCSTQAQADLSKFNLVSFAVCQQQRQRISTPFPKIALNIPRVWVLINYLMDLEA